LPTCRVRAQLSCASEEELAANLRWVCEACEQEGEAFPEGDEDTLVLVLERCHDGWILDVEYVCTNGLVFDVRKP
jgi:hypothetical protein